MIGWLSMRRGRVRNNDVFYIYLWNRLVLCIRLSQTASPNEKEAALHRLLTVFLCVILGSFLLALRRPGNQTSNNIRVTVFLLLWALEKSGIYDWGYWCWYFDAVKWHADISFKYVYGCTMLSLLQLLPRYYAAHWNAKLLPNYTCLLFHS